jgi:hypothetical protein
MTDDEVWAEALSFTDYNLSTDDCDTCYGLLASDDVNTDAEIIRMLRIHLNSGHYVDFDAQGRNIIP